MTKMALQIADDYVDTAPVLEEVDAVANQLLVIWRAPGLV